MAEVPVSEVILKCLRQENVKRIIGISDGFYHGVMLKAEEFGIRWIAPRHEAAAVHICEGIFKSSGEIPVVMAGAGPGTANMVSGIICAREEGVPVIAISSQRRQDVVYPSRMGIYQGCEQYDLFRLITKWNTVIHSPERVSECIQTAFREAMSGRPGPVHIDIPVDILDGVCNDEKIRILAPHQYRSTLPLAPSSQDIDQMVALIAAAKQPFLIAGTGVLNSNGTEDLLELVELLNCPATTSMAARSALPNEHPNYLVGYIGGLTARKEADVILAIGTCLGELDLPFDHHWRDYNEQKVIQVDFEQRHIGINRPIHLGVVADARLTIRALVKRLREMETQPLGDEIVGKYKQQDDQWYAQQRTLLNDYQGEKIHPAASVEIARSVFGPDAINVGDGGNTSLYNGIFTKFSHPRTSLGIFEFGHLGTGIPYAIGAKLANPGKEVYCITGDGAAGFNIMELDTALREKIKITVIVHAEESWSMEEIVQLLLTGDESKAVATHLLPTRWDRIAEGIGCHAEYVDKVENLRDALERAKVSDFPALVCVKTDKQTNLVPPLADMFEQVYTGAPPTF